LIYKRPPVQKSNGRLHFRRQGGWYVYDTSLMAACISVNRVDGTFMPLYIYATEI